MIKKSDLESVIQKIELKGLSKGVVSELRDQYERYEFKFCAEEDLEQYSPAIQGKGFNIYFFDNSYVCSHVTENSDSATGMLLTENENLA